MCPRLSGSLQEGDYGDPPHSGALCKADGDNAAKRFRALARIQKLTLRSGNQVSLMFVVVTVCSPGK